VVTLVPFSGIAIRKYHYDITRNPTKFVSGNGH